MIIYQLNIVITSIKIFIKCTIRRINTVSSACYTHIEKYTSFMIFYTSIENIQKYTVQYLVNIYSTNNYLCDYYCCDC